MPRVGILTFHRAINYGALLQAYALQTAISKLSPELSVKIIDYRTHAIEDVYDPDNMHSARLPAMDALLWLARRHRRVTARKNFDAFLNAHTARTPPLWRDELDGIADDFDAIVAGSDQIWNAEIAHGDAAFLLDFVQGKENVRRVSYAASFGRVSLPEKSHAFFRRHLSPERWDAMSVRESSAAEIVFGLTGFRPEVVLDPTVLLAKSDWEGLCRPVKALEGQKFLIIYNQVLPKKLIKFARKLVRRSGLKLYQLGGGLKNPDIPILRGLTPEQFLWVFRHAEGTIVNSFHGTAFSVIFEKPFFVETTDAHGKFNTRIQGLLETAGIQGRDISAADFADFSDAEDDYLRSGEINWHLVQQNLDAARQKSLDFLRSALLG